MADQTLPGANGATDAIVEVRNVKKYFPITAGVFSRHVADVKAVDDVSFSIKPGETLGLVGESGSGKTTIGRCILRLLDPTGGDIFFERKNITKLPQSAPLWDSKALSMRELRGRMQIIFQDPYASLNPRMTVGDIISEPLQIHGIDGQAHPSKADIEKRVNELLRTVRLAPYHANRYPHEFSGGQRQRIGIARALAVNPKFIVADEPVSALDVSIQAQVVNLLQDLQAQLGLTYLFIAHDLSVVRHISDRVAVMYVGKLVEMADRDELYKRPLHPYTQSLLSAIPIPDPRVEARRERIILTGDIPSPVNPPKACRFNTRCPIAYERCFIEEPLLKKYGEHLVACHKVEELHGQQPDITKRTAAPAVPAS
ncbi:MAG: ATP-binding cassette domain-containing protein [Candidatus Eremiobacteraeota bacterium]|nr:ATP-binding cassette domain-containing protein [Candidatus Eremiobacteraeota bacterium]MBV8223517.1 ATP-binding cassette domain-containing protein [Candidatus Eremiobacteraeota bacterium]